MSKVIFWFKDFVRIRERMHCAAHSTLIKDIKERNAVSQRKDNPLFYLITSFYL